MQVGFGLLHRADSTNDICIGFFGLIFLEGIIPGLKGYIVGIAGQKNQIIFLHHNGVNDLLIKLMQQFFVLQLGLAQVHQQLVLLRVCHLAGLKSDINEIFSNGTG